MRDALGRASRMDWVKGGDVESVVRLPAGCGADRSVDGVLRTYSAGIVRAEGRLTQGAVCGYFRDTTCRQSSIPWMITVASKSWSEALQNGT